MRIYLSAMLLFIVFLTTSCQELDMEPGGVVPLSRIANVENHNSLTLIGPEWKLIGFGDASNNRVRIAEPAERENFSPYLLWFNEDKTVGGVTSTNSVFGIYELLEDNQLHFTQFGPMTYINELFDGPMFIESMREVNSYMITKKGLVLFYSGNTNYLLFKPV